MQTQNPYSAPKAEITKAGAGQFSRIKPFSSNGRIGRIRYIGYSIGVPWLVLILTGLLAGALGKLAGEALLIAVFVAGNVLALIAVVLLTIQRAHDFDKSGWLSLLLLIPLANFAFWFIPGTDGENKYGLKPPPNGVLTVIVALIVPVAVAVILAAIAIPAYQDYVNRAKAQQQSQ